MIVDAQAECVSPWSLGRWVCGPQLSLAMSNRNFKTSILDVPRAFKQAATRTACAPLHTARRPSGRGRGDLLVFRQSQSSARRWQVPVWPCSARMAKTETARFDVAGWVFQARHRTKSWVREARCAPPVKRSWTTRTRLDVWAER